jgi:pilus assembly protein CpaD
MPRHTLSLVPKPVLFLLLARCSALTPLPTSAPPPAPTSERVSYEHAVRFPTGSTALDARELDLLDEFLAKIPSHATAHVSLVAKEAAIGASVRHHALAPERLSMVAAAIRASLGPSTDIHAQTNHANPVTGDPSASPDTVDTLVTVDFVRLPSCPDRSRDPAFDPLNLPLSNLGCANAVNLGLMLADPRDLEQGRALAPADGAREAGAISRYETDKVKALHQEAGAQ